MSFSIIVPSRNATNLVACVKAIREAEETARIILVDDGIAWAGPLFPELEAIQTGDLQITVVPGGKQPFCFARNVNIGIRAAGEDDVILLGDDGLLKTPNGFTMLALKAAELNCGLLASSCNNVGNLNQHRRYDAPIVRWEPRMVCFVAVFIPRSTINALAEDEYRCTEPVNPPGGLLDERFGSGGFEDDDYCLRVRRAGLQIGIFDGCFVDHTGLESTFRGPGGPGYNPRGAEIFREKWGAGNHDL